MTAPQATRRRARARWLRASRPDAAQVDALALSLRLPRTLCELLVARGFATEEAARRFLRPQLDQLHPPAALKDLDRAVDRLARAIREGERIVVHGDYDVDGMCSTTLMTRAMRVLGGDVVPFIPDRVSDGYDLGPAGVQSALAQKAGVVLTCDCGTSAVESVRTLQDAGIDVIVTDHHLPGGPLPPALAVLNPRRADDASPDKDLAAVGVAFKLALALTQAMGGNENVVLNMLDLVALATIADVAPLRGENRVFVRRGLPMIRESKSLGLRALVRAAGLDAKEMTAGRVGFILAPRLNALGRIGRALDGVSLLLGEREDECNRLARQCEELNRERQDMDRSILDEALRRVAQTDLDATWGLVLAGVGWHPGVIGIVASRVVEQTGRPAMLVAVHDGIGKGSGRSIPAFDLHAALQQCDDLLIRHGGHRAAAGLTIDAARLDAFRERFNDVARAQLTADDLVPVIRIDLALPLDDATADLEALLRHLEPCGVGNPGPVFSASGVEVTSGPQKIGTDGLKLFLRTGRGPLEAVGWGLAHRAGELVDARDGSLEIAFKLDRNEYRGTSTLQAVLLDFRPTGVP